MRSIISKKAAVLALLFLPGLFQQCVKDQPVVPGNHQEDTTHIPHNDTTQISYDSVTTAVKVALPAGVTGISVSSLNVCNSVGSMKLDDSGKATLFGIGGGRQLVSVCDSSGNVLLAGWIDAAHPEINTRTTATLLLYMNLAFFTLPPLMQEQSLAILDSSPEVAELSDSLAKAMVANPAVFSDRCSSIDTVIATIVGRIHTQCTTDTALAKSKSLLIQPAGVRSGITIDVDSGINTIGFINEARRRTYIWVERVSYKNATGATVESPAVIKEFWGPMPTGVGGVVTMLTDLIRGRRAYSAVKTDKSIDVPVYPPDAQSTQYKISIVGPGSAIADLGSLSDDQREQWEWVCQYSLLMDYVMPAVLNIVIPLNGTALDKWKGDGTASKLKDIVGFFVTKSPVIGTKLSKGQIKESAKDIIQIIASNGTTRDFLYSKITSLIENTGGAAASTAVKAQINTLKAVLKKYDLILTSIDLVWQAENVLVSDQADVYEVTAFPPKVVITPLLPKVRVGETVKLTASIPETQGGPELSLTWKWSVKKSLGTVSNDIKTDGTSGFESTLNWATFKAGKTSGIDSAIIEVFQIRDGVKSPLGRGSAAVTVVNDSDYAIRLKHKVTVFDGEGVMDLAYFIFPKIDGANSYLFDLNDNGYPYYPANGGLGFGDGNVFTQSFPLKPGHGGRLSGMADSGCNVWLYNPADDPENTYAYLKDIIQPGANELVLIIERETTSFRLDNDGVTITKVPAEQVYAEKNLQAKWEIFEAKARNWTLSYKKW